jgi:hypothetical protein
MGDGGRQCQRESLSPTRRDRVDFLERSNGMSGLKFETWAGGIDLDLIGGAPDAAKRGVEAERSSSFIILRTSHPLAFSILKSS